MDMLHNFTGLEVMPYCTTARAEPIRIDRVRAIVARTIYGDIRYCVEGRVRKCGFSCGKVDSTLNHGQRLTIADEWAPLTWQFTTPEAACTAAAGFEKRIAAARAEEIERYERAKRG